jgi:hypothetical protein
MQCECGAESCRGIITGTDWRKPEIQHKCGGYFSWFIQRRIDAVQKLTGPLDPKTAVGGFWMQ